MPFVDECMAMPRPAPRTGAIKLAAGAGLRWLEGLGCHMRYNASNVRRNGYTTYAAPIADGPYRFGSLPGFTTLVPGAPIIWEYREPSALEIPKCNVAATRYIHEVVAKGRSRSVGSARTYGSHLATWFRFCDEASVSAPYPILQDILVFRDWLQEVDDEFGRSDGDGLVVSSVKGVLCAVIDYYRWAFRNHLVDGDPMLLTDRNGDPIESQDGVSQRLRTKEILLSGSVRIEPRFIPKPILDAIYDKLPTPYLLCSTAAVSCGLRASEVAEIPLTALRPSIDLSDGEFITLEVRGKGGVVAPVYVPSVIYSRLLHYRDFTRWETVQRMKRVNRSYKEPKKLFITERFGEAISGRTLAKAFYKANDALGYTVERYFFHGLRHTFAYTLSAELHAANEAKKRDGEAGFDVLGIVQERMRHADPRSTEVYLRVGVREKALLSAKVNGLFESYLNRI
jgi:integrase